MLLEEMPVQNILSKRVINTYKSMVESELFDSTSLEMFLEDQYFPEDIENGRRIQVYCNHFNYN